MVLDCLARALRDGGARLPLLVTMFDDGRGLTPAIDAIPKEVWRPGRSRWICDHARRWLLPMFPIAVDVLSRRLECRVRGDLGRDAGAQREGLRVADDGAMPDLLLSTSSAAIKSLRAPDGVPHVCYIHAPARYIWSLGREYGAKGRWDLAGRARQWGLSLARGPMRAWDRRTASRVTRFIANSAHIARQVRACYGVEARVVHPPVRTRYFTPSATATDRRAWLVVSALEPYKRVDVAIEAARHAGRDLVIVGDGSQRERLMAMARSGAGPGVRFEGRVSLERLRELYRGARALIFPQVEDFGIAAVEAQACGTPVIARAAGGALETVIDGVTGVLVPEHDGDPAAMARAFAQADARLDVIGQNAIGQNAIGQNAIGQNAIGQDACVRHAARFGEEAFVRAMADALADVAPSVAEALRRGPPPGPGSVLGFQ